MLEYKHVRPTPHNRHWLQRQAPLTANGPAPHYAFLRSRRRNGTSFSPPAANRRGRTRFGRAAAHCSAVDGWTVSLPVVIGTLDLRKGGSIVFALRPGSICTPVWPRGVAVGHLCPAPNLRQHFSHSRVRQLQVVFLTGLTDAQLYAEMRRAGALLRLARCESFGYPLIEAAATGLPVVATAGLIWNRFRSTCWQLSWIPCRWRQQWTLRRSPRPCRAPPAFGRCMCCTALSGALHWQPAWSMPTSSDRGWCRPTATARTRENRTTAASS